MRETYREKLTLQRRERILKIEDLTIQMLFHAGCEPYVMFYKFQSFED